MLYFELDLVMDSKLYKITYEGETEAIPKKIVFFN